jgi:hypothetical protein
MQQHRILAASSAFSDRIPQAFIIKSASLSVFRFISVTFHTPKDKMQLFFGWGGGHLMAEQSRTSLAASADDAESSLLIAA